MNRQALAFLTMFSLVLMLSVYYVTLPADTETVMKDAEVSSANQQTAQEEEEKDTETTSEKEENTEDSEQEKLQEEINTKKQEEMNQQSSIVADENAAEEEKQQALATIEVLKEQSNMQDTIISTLQEQGIQTAVELSDSTCVITVFDQEESTELAKKIMDIVTPIVGQSYLIEITFI